MPSLETPIEMQRPAVVRFGAGEVATLASWLEASGVRRPFVVADRVNAARLEVLGLSGAELFGEVEPEPGLANLEAAVAAAKAAQADAVVGFGGGSAMDLAKLVAVLVGSDQGLRDISGPNRAPARRVRLAQVPTTAGTGSEVGTRALITDPETMNKIATESREMLADIAIIDPVLTVSVPPMVTAATGVDAMAHCVEAFTSKRAHPIIDDYALRGIELVGRYLGRAVKDGADIEARAGLALAAFYGGVCLGPVNTTAGHALAYPLGTRHKLAHGIANALIFPHVLAVNAPAVPEKTAAVGRARGFGAEGRQQVLGGAQDFCERLGLDMALRAHGVPRDDLAASAREAHGIRRLLDWNPVDLSEADILEIYEAAY
jgi:alcohol dehydrogenase class IV